MVMRYLLRYCRKRRISNKLWYWQKSDIEYCLHYVYILNIHNSKFLSHICYLYAVHYVVRKRVRREAPAVKHTQTCESPPLPFLHIPPTCRRAHLLPYINLDRFDVFSFFQYGRDKTHRILRAPPTLEFGHSTNLNLIPGVCSRRRTVSNR